jgi:tripartite-type tricarboxylate transporter receptor subunit TctC
MKHAAGIGAVSAALGVGCAGAIDIAGAQGTSIGTAQSYPAKPVRLIVAAAPGGNLDLIARSVAQALTASLGSPMVVENRPGANAIIGTEYVARSAPDGYTVLMAAPGFLIAPMMMRSAPYDPLRDFTGVSLIATLAQMLVVHPSVPAKTVRELIALAKARPGELNCVTSGNGSGSHLAMELFTRQAGVRLTRIPYSGDAPALVHLIGGQVSLKFDNLTTAIPLVNAGRLRALGVTSPNRSALLPNVPAISETLPGYAASIFNGMVAPAATPKEIVARIHAEIARFTQTPDVRARFAQQGVELQSSPAPEHFTAYLRSEYARWAKVIQEAGITAD